MKIDTNISLDINENHPSYIWAKSQSDSVQAFGHIGTHVDCYTKFPENSVYEVKTVSIDCRESMPTLEQVEILDLKDKALVLYTGNLDINGYGCKEYGQFSSELNSDVLDVILSKNPAFIVIDSYGIGAHGDEHISFDKRCEKNGCFVIENVILTTPLVNSLIGLHLIFGLGTKSTGKRCQATAILSEKIE